VRACSIHRPVGPHGDGAVNLDAGRHKRAGIGWGPWTPNIATPKE
jgi:hypothetical protein